MPDPTQLSNDNAALMLYFAELLLQGDISLEEVQKKLTDFQTVS